MIASCFREWHAAKKEKQPGDCKNGSFSAKATEDRKNKQTNKQKEKLMQIPQAGFCHHRSSSYL